MSRLSSDDSVFLDEQQTPGLSPSDDAQPSPTDSNGSVFLSSDAENGVDEKRKHAQLIPTISHPANSDAEVCEIKKKLSISRSPASPDILNSTKPETKKSGLIQFSKANAKFHKLFQDVPNEELLKQSFTCALQKELLYHGKLYISENWIGFHSKVFGKGTKIIIPVVSVVMMKKTRTALLVPNALVISTATERYTFVSLLFRDTTYKLLKSVCTHLEIGSTTNSPFPSPAVNSFRVPRPESLPLDFNEEYPQLDEMVRQRREVLDEFSSTCSQTPESENSQEFPLDDQPILKVSKAEKIPALEEKARNAPLNAGGSRLQRLFHHTGSRQLLSLNGLLICYAILVCILMFSTIYMRSKIIILEERLSTMGPFFVNEQTPGGLAMRPVLHVNVDTICDELTSNLAKLDKIQKNLQRLLEDIV
ncbi:GRAM domain-containing protein 2B isoform X2 [Lissotriton helveticus]